MLQTLQLEEVSIRYAEEIAELRDFLAKAGLSIGTAEALAGMAKRLPVDRAFHRDLTSHLWVMMHRSDRKQVRETSYADLLGVLTIAAADVSFAAAAGEEDAHDLLLFLMEARSSLEGFPGPKRSTGVESPRAASPRAASPSAESPRPEEPPARPVTMPVATPESFNRPVPPQRTGLHGQDEFNRLQDKSGGRRWIRWAAAVVVCFLAASAGSLWLRYRPSTTPGGGNRAVGNDGRNTATSTAAPAEGAVAPSPTAPSGETLPSLNISPESRESVASESESRAPARKIPRSAPTPSGLAARNATEQPRLRVGASPAASLPGVSPQAAAGASYPPLSAKAVAMVPPAMPPAASASLPSPRLSKTSNSAFTAVPSATLSNRLGSPSVPAYASGDMDANGHRYPRLLRRQPLGPSAAPLQDEGTLVAENQPAELPPGRALGSGAGRNGVVSAPRRGIVRPTSVGIMAANILYSPIPAYPAEASAAHVQGEVKVQAEVDRDGNVASARVVSGPPLLRDAALDAVLRWRYRPFVSAGRPMSMSATAIMEFQLP